MQHFPTDLQPPIHIPIAYGPIETTEIALNLNASEYVSDGQRVCLLCGDGFEVSVSSFKIYFKASPVHKGASISCPDRCPNGNWHVTCLARHLVSVESSEPIREMVPLQGQCPACNNARLFWPDLMASLRKSD